MSIDTSKVAASNQGDAATAKKPGRAGAVANWVDERLGLAGLLLADPGPLQSAAALL